MVIGIFHVTHTRLAIVSTDTPTTKAIVANMTDIDIEPTLPTTTSENQDAAVVRSNKRRITSVATTSISTTTTYTSPVPTTTLSTLKTMAWIYPGNPACNASTEYADGRKIDVLKAEFFTINGGLLTLLTTTNSFCNGYSAANISRLKQYSTEQYATISSGSTNDMDTFLVQALGSASNDITTLVDFTVTNNITGIELDFEDFGGWSATSYANYKKFVTVLGNALRAKGKKLMLDGPAVSNASEENWFLWRYSDFTVLPVDTIVVMAYDYQYDNGVGSPVTPFDWLKNVILWTSGRYPKERIAIGLPSYGYQGTAGTYRSVILNADQIKTKAGYTTALRDSSSGEMTWTSGSTVYFYQDAQSLNMKRDVVASLGITSVSVWHLGGNPWF